MPSRHEARAPGLRCVTTEAGPIACQDFHAASDRELEPHAHPAVHFCFLLEGSLAERDGGSERVLRPGDARASPGGDEHRIRVGPEGLRCLLLFVDDGVISDSGLVGPGGRRFVSGPRVAELGSLLAREAARADDASPIALEMLTLELLAVLGRPNARRPDDPPAWLARTRERLREIPDTAPTLGELAEDAGVSRAHLARAFRQHFGCTVGTHLRALRLEKARRLILTTDLPLGRIAYWAGFADQSHMTRCLRAAVGLPPGRLRDAARREG